MRGLFFTLLAIVSALPVRAETISFDLHDGLIFIEARLQGSPEKLNFILDSGSETSILSHKAAKRLGVRLIGSEPVQSVSGLLSAYRSEEISINLGRVKPPPRELLVIGLSRESEILGREVDGLLGADFLSNRILEIDYRRHPLDLEADAIPAYGATVLELKRNYGALCIPVTANGIELEMVRVDTGCAKGLCWTPPQGSNERRPLLPASNSRRKAAVKIGKHEFDKVDSLVFWERIFPGEDGLLGNDVLRRFEVVRIDSRGGRIALGAH